LTDDLSLYVDLAVGKPTEHGGRQVQYRESRRVESHRGFDIERLRADAHNALDIALDDLAEKIEWTKGIRARRVA
jgi:hypothetical protein